MQVARLFVTAGATVSALLGVFLALHKLKRLRSSLRHIPGPPEKSWIFGHFFELLGVGTVGEIHSKWAQEFGKILTYDMFLLGSRVMVSDADALKRVMVTGVSNYIRPAYVQMLLGDLLGHGLLLSEGEQHDRQRKIVSEAFHFENLKNLSFEFSRQAEKLVDVWMRKLSDMPAGSALEIDAIQATHALTLDIIGLIGFGYDFDACNDAKTELGDAYKDMLSITAINLFNTIIHMWPFKYLPLPAIKRQRRAFNQIRDVMARIVAKGRTELSTPAPGGTGPNLLALLLRASNKAPSGGSGLSDVELYDNILTFLVAGHETTANGVCWALCARPGYLPTPRLLLLLLPGTVFPSHVTSTLLVPAASPSSTCTFAFPMPPPRRLSFPPNHALTPRSCAYLGVVNVPIMRFPPSSTLFLSRSLTPWSEWSEYTRTHAPPNALTHAKTRTHVRTHTHVPARMHARTHRPAPPLSSQTCSPSTRRWRPGPGPRCWRWPAAGGSR
jgi:cytochrome P450